MTEPDLTQRHAALWDLPARLALLNHGSFGACPTAVRVQQATLRDHMERDTHGFFNDELDGRLVETRKRVALELSVDPDDLVPMPNTTTGVNTVLQRIPLAGGDEILVLDQGYNACVNAVRFVTERVGAKVVVAELPFPCPSEDAVEQAILSAVTPQTRVAVIDHITSPMGFVLPVRRIVRSLQKRNVRVLVDGAHAPGQVGLDLDTLDADYYAGNGHKWWCGPKGSAFLHVRRDRQEGFRPLVISHGANKPLGGRSRFRREFDWNGTDDPTPWLCLPTAISHLKEAVVGGWPAIHKRNRRLALAARDQLCEDLAVEPPCPDSMVGSMAVIPLPEWVTPGPRTWNDPIPSVYRFLREEHGIVAVFVPWLPTRQWMVRVSAHLYNDMEQFCRLGKALQGFRTPI